MTARGGTGAVAWAKKANPGDVERFLAAEQAELDAAWAEPEPIDGRCWSDEDEEEAIRLDRFWGGGD